MTYGFIPHGIANVTTPGIYPLLIGGGGYVTHIDWPTTSSPKLIRTDVGGAYMWNAGTSRWQQLCTKARLPSTDWGVTGTDAMAGVSGIASAPTNPNRIVMVYGPLFSPSHIFVSNDRGVTFTRTAASSFTIDPNDGNPRQCNPKLSIDPKNQDIWYVGTNAAGMWRTIDAGANWTTIAGGFTTAANVSLSATPTIVFDPDPTSARTTLVGGVTSTKNIHAYSPGIGVYRSTDGGSTWTLITGTAALVPLIDCKCGIDGTYYCITENQFGPYRIRLSQTAVEDISIASNGYWNIIPSLIDAAKLVVVKETGGVWYRSTNATDPTPANVTAGWAGGASPPNFGFNALGDVPWHVVAGFHPGGGVMDPDTANHPDRVWGANGIGVCYNDCVGTNNGWTTQSAGISELINFDVISVPGHNPVFCFMDRPVMVVSDFTQIMSTYWPHTTPTSGVPVGVSGGFQVDWASSDPNFCIAICPYHSNPDNSCYSTDGGANWRVLWDDGKWPWQFYTRSGGSVAASTPSNFIFCEENNGDLHVTHDGGATWTTPAGSAFDGGTVGMQVAGAGIIPGWGSNFQSHHRPLSADRTALNTFYIYNENAAINGGGIHRSIDGGTSWHRIFSGPLSTSGNTGGAKIKTVPHLSADTTGCFFFTDGFRGNVFNYCRDATATTPALITILGTYSLMDVSFGIVKAGNDFPSVYVLGFINGVFDAYRCDASKAQWAASGVTPVAWLPVGGTMFGPTGTLDRMASIAGDMNKAGVFYLGGANESYAVMT